MKFLVIPLVAMLAVPASAQSGKAQMNDLMSAVHKATGVVGQVDSANKRVTIKHDPIQSLNWPTMTMDFTVKEKSLLDTMRKGRRISFEFVLEGNEFVVTSAK